MTTTVSKQTPQIAQARSAAYTLIAYGFQYPDRALIETLSDPNHWAHWPDVLIGVHACTRESLGVIRDALQTQAATLAKGDDGDLSALSCRHDALFGHAVRGKCPVYEMEYGRTEIIRQASDLADISGFYRAFGLDFANGANGRPDHITAECEFMGALCAKESHALEQDGAEGIDVCVDAERSFLSEHLGRWLPAFVHRVQEADHEGLYGALARFAVDFVNAECDQFEIQVGPTTLELKPADPEADREISCTPKDCGAQSSADQFVQLNTELKNDQEA